MRERSTTDAGIAWESVRVIDTEKAESTERIPQRE
jgi:hypothetical protein